MMIADSVARVVEEVLHTKNYSRNGQGGKSGIYNAAAACEEVGRSHHSL